MGKLVLPGFTETDLGTRALLSGQELRESIGIPGCEAQLFVFQYPAGQVNAEHTHEETRITFIRSGRAAFHLAGAAATVEAGDLVLIPAGIVHSFEAGSEEPLRIAEFVIPR